MYYILLLVSAGMAVNAQSVMTGNIHPEFQHLAEVHAQYQADAQQQGHQGFEKRYAILSKKFPDLKIAEICSESWPGQTAKEAAKDAFEVSWPVSLGHWKVVNSPCFCYGISMAKGGDIWYVCMIVGQ